jgi:hypothetical protein
MVKRHKVEEIAGVLEFEGKTGEDPEIIDWLAEHKARNGGKIRLSQGGKGIRVAFSKESDMVLWKARSDQAAKARKASS